jgi:hypothetical protein
MLGSLLLTLLAASTLITIGPYILLDIQLPARITQTLAIFRASGRLFWPVGYLIMLSAIYLTWQNYGKRWATALLATAIIVQFADLAPLRKMLWLRIEHQGSSPLISATWKELGPTVSKLLVMPPWQCAAQETPGGVDSFTIFGALAAAQGLKTNAIYGSRFSPNAEDLYCRGMVDSVLHGKFETDAAYVVSDSIAKDLVTAWSSRINCERVDGFNLCRVVNRIMP